MKGEPIVQAFANQAEVLGRKTASHVPTITLNQNTQQKQQSSCLLPPLAVQQLAPPVAPPPRVPVMNRAPAPVQTHPQPQQMVVAPVLRVPVCAVTPPPPDEQRMHRPLPRVSVAQPQLQVVILPPPQIPAMTCFPTPKCQSIHPPNLPRAVTLPPIPTTPDTQFSAFVPPHMVTPQLIARGPLPKIYVPAPYRLMQHLLLVAFHIFDANGKKLSIDDLLKGPMQSTWIRSTDTELGSLLDGIKGRVKGSGTIAFIRKEQVPVGKKVTYANM
eukprot:6362071-Ditylum_brightwellii.AAC.1